MDMEIQEHENKIMLDLFGYVWAYFNEKEIIIKNSK